MTAALGDAFVNGEQETPVCAVCSRAADDAIVVGTKARFGMAVRNVACRECGLVFISPRPTPAAMNEYYRGEYRKHYNTVRIHGPNGWAAPGEPGYEEAIDHNHHMQMTVVEKMVGLKAGDHVLEIGCKDGRTLRMMRDKHGIIPQGIEPGGEEAALANDAGVSCFQGLLEEFPAEGRKFDLVQMFHVLEHFHEPLAALVRIRSLLRKGGKVMIEVPNVCQPYGMLEENFFQNAHLYNFSASTLVALLKRAGFTIQQSIDTSALFVVGVAQSDATDAISYSRSLLGDPMQTGEWIALRLKTYAHIETLRLAYRRRTDDPVIVSTMQKLLAFPTFDVHTASVIREVGVDLVKRGRAPEAQALVSAASKGTTDPRAKAQLDKLAQNLSA